MILFIDCYDSFTYNLVHLVEKTLGLPVAVVHMDSLDATQLESMAHHLDAVLVGPGPGEPANAKDAGVITDLWRIMALKNVPVLGICFGFQSLALACGAIVEKMKMPFHGQYGTIQHSQTGLFDSIPQNYKVIRYHSLCVKESTAKDLVVLARASEDGALMGIKHTTNPWYAVQFHPESVLSQHGPELVRNFWRIAVEFNTNAERALNQADPLVERLSQRLRATPFMQVPSTPQSQEPAVLQLKINLDPLKVCQGLYDENQKFVMLHSAAPPGQWSIIGLLYDSTTQIRLHKDSALLGPLSGTPAPTRFEGKDHWAQVGEFMSKRIRRGFRPDLPFVGGLVGYVTYEGACSSSLEGHTPVETDPEHSPQSESSLVFVENCILINTLAGASYAIGKPEFVQEFEIKASRYAQVQLISAVIPKVSVDRPQKEEYLANIQKCMDELMSGNSYELCLTDQTLARFEKDVEPWDLFKHLVLKNPAPYSVFMDFDDTLVGTSPERFMSWDADGVCEFRPIKGTVKKGPGMTFEKASAILSTPKEHGENLMIVDLIRHDLGYLLDQVKCTQAMRVEEYKTVYQLVSVIQGSLKSAHLAYSGLDVLVHSLPPGSMTGAPKIRSVEILKRLEKRPRGLYSGVCGYWSLNDIGDWSVVIRSAFKYGGQSIWRLGSGGAITVLSDPDDEFEEMETKLESALQAFES